MHKVNEALSSVATHCCNPRIVYSMSLSSLQEHEIGVNGQATDPCLCRGAYEHSGKSSGLAEIMAVVFLQVEGHF